MNDKYLGTCVICSRPVVPICDSYDRSLGEIRDFCPDCIDTGEHTDNFGRCYQCSDFHDHDACIGVPCQCACPTPDQRKREALRQQAMSKLTLQELTALGVV